jgi:hypothetical protein
VAFEGSDVLDIAERVNARLARGPWNTAALEPKPSEAELETAAEVAVFALELAGKRGQARRGGRFGRLIVTFALAACVALSSFAAACDKPDATAEETQTAINSLPSTSGSTASITAPARASPGLFTDMVLLDAGSDSQPWAVLQTSDSSSPILVDRVGAGLDTVGATYSLAAQPIAVGTRDGPSQFLDPLQPATYSSSVAKPVTAAVQQLEQRWSQDERYLAPTRAIAGQTTVLDAAYNAPAAAAAGGTHTYLNGVVLRAEPDKPVLSVIDKALLESGAPTRAEDVVYVAIQPSQQSSYNPGQVVNLRDVAMNQQQTDVDGQSTTLYIVDAAVNGARVEPTGSVDLQSLLQPRLQRVDQDIAASSQAVAGGTPAAAGATSTPGPTQAPQQIIVREQRGPSFVDDFLIWMWLSNSGFYRGPSVIINNPPASSNRPSDQTYYSAPPRPSGSTPSTVANSQAASRSTALEAARSAVSGQSSGTGGGVAATNKSAAATSLAAGAATAKAASVASSVSAASTGKSAPSVSSSSGSSALSRSAGSTSAGTRGSAGISSSSSSSRGSSGSLGGFGSSSGGKGISGSSSS